MKDKCFDKLSEFKKEKKSFKEFEKLDKLLLYDIEKGSWLGCTSSEVSKSVHNQSKAITNTPSEQATFVNFIIAMIDLLIYSNQK